ncbi:hypothetical protein HGRIS_004510 [Hohenbuehelia grisea]|uniref:Uncharacterized protein n=1 Tax=Hohenbuehelia grisea TaxID=104357 RepID=A0ABR3JDR9_9AGAR
MVFTSALLPFVVASVAYAASASTKGTKATKDANGALRCFGSNVIEFFLPEAPDQSNCCAAPNVIFWLDKDKKIGECCGAGQTWSGDQTTGVGGCCDGDQTWSGTATLGGCCPPGHAFSGDATTGTGGCCPTGTTWTKGACVKPSRARPPKSVCASSGEPVCGDDNDLGIKYGHCYVLRFTDGIQLGAQRDDLTYAKGGYFQDIPFKVCKATTDCSLGDAVPSTGSFYLQDQAGRFNDATGAPGWVNNAAGGTHIAFATDPSQAGLFKGTPSCSGGHCTLRLRGGPTGDGGIGPTCPMPDHGLTFWQNPNLGMMLQFIETACTGPDLPFVPPGAAPAKKASAAARLPAAPSAAPAATTKAPAGLAGIVASAKSAASAASAASKAK